MKKKLGLLVVGLILLVGLVACQSDEDTSSSDGDSSNNSDGDVTELTLWNIWTEEDATGKIAVQRVDAFNESHDDIQINLETTAHDQYKTKLKTQAAGKQLPDMFQVWPGAELAPMAEGDVLKSIDDIKDNWDGLIPDNIMDDYAYDGTQYAIPGTLSYTSIVYYDEDMLSDAGYDSFPATYDEFKQLIKDLKANDVTPIELGNKAQWVLQSVYLSTIADRVTGSDFLGNVLDGDAAFTDDDFVEAVSVIDELAKMDAFNEDMNTIDDGQARDDFLQGNAAILLGGSWTAGQILDALPDDKNVGIAIFPEIEGGQGNPGYVSGVSSTGIALNADLDEEKTEAAEEFLKFFYSEETFANWLKDGVMIPANIDIPDDVDPLTQKVQEETSEGIAPVYDAVLSPEMVSVLNNGLQAISIGNMTPEELAQKMQDELDK